MSTTFRTPCTNKCDLFMLVSRFRLLTVFAFESGCLGLENQVFDCRYIVKTTFTEGGTLVVCRVIFWVIWIAFVHHFLPAFGRLPEGGAAVRKQASNSKQQPSIRHQAASIKHHAANIKNFGSKILPSTTPWKLNNLYSVSVSVSHSSFS